MVGLCQGGAAPPPDRFCCKASRWYLWPIGVAKSRGLSPYRARRMLATPLPRRSPWHRRFNRRSPATQEVSGPTSILWTQGCCHAAGIVTEDAARVPSGPAVVSHSLVAPLAANPEADHASVSTLCGRRAPGSTVVVRAHAVSPVTGTPGQGTRRSLRAAGRPWRGRQGAVPGRPDPRTWLRAVPGAPRPRRDLVRPGRGSGSCVGGGAPGARLPGW